MTRHPCLQRSTLDELQARRGKRNDLAFRLRDGGDARVMAMAARTPGRTLMPGFFDRAIRAATRLVLVRHGAQSRRSDAAHLEARGGEKDAQEHPQESVQA